MLLVQIVWHRLLLDRPFGRHRARQPLIAALLPKKTQKSRCWFWRAKVCKTGGISGL